MYRFVLHLSRCLIGMACLVPVSLHAAPECSGAEALVLLERMSRAGMSGNHYGMATLQRGGETRVLQIDRSTADDGTTDTLTLLSGQRAEVVRANHPRDCIHPGHALLRLRQSDADACGLSAHYRLSLEEGEEVAGRATDRIIAQPRDMYRYSHVLEIDRETGQLLKQTTLTGDGRPLERFQYASLGFEAGTGAGAKRASSAAADSGGKPQEVDRVAAPHDGGGSMLPGKSPSSVVARWQVDWLPAGFVATRNDAPGFRQTYTDGMSSFSVFLEPVDTPMQPGEGAVREGSTLAYTRGVRLADSAVLVTVIGEVPVNTARIVADSVRMR